MSMYVCYNTGLTYTVRTVCSSSAKGTTTVTVSVLDLNDNAPEFTVGSPYTIHREETYTEADVFITTITATDIDSGNNREITYSVTSDPSGLFYFVRETVSSLCESLCIHTYFSIKMCTYVQQYLLQYVHTYCTHILMYMTVLGRSSIYGSNDLRSLSTALVQDSTG